MQDTLQRAEGAAAFAVFILLIPASNWMIGHVGTSCPAGGPCIIPVAPGITAPSGVLTVGLALVLRDVVQRRLGIAAGLGAIAIGAVISALVAPPAIVVASAAAFVLSELADFFIYTPLQRRRFVMAVIVSSMVGILVDSAVFLHLAFGSLDYLPGQILGKLWMVALAIPFLRWLRRRDRRLGWEPAGR